MDQTSWKIMLFAVVLVLPMQLFAAAIVPSEEMTKKCQAAWAELKPLVLTPVFTSFEEQQPAIAQSLANHGLVNNDEVVTLIRTGLSKAWWHFRGHTQNRIHNWVQPQLLKPYKPAHSVLLRNLLLKYNSHHEEE